MGRQIFIHHDGALGDFLLSLPAIEALKLRGDSIYLAGRCDVVDFLKKIGYISHGIYAGSRMFLPLFLGGPDRGLEEFLSSFDRVYVFSVTTSSDFAANIRAFFPNTKFIRTIPPPESPMHVSDFRRRQVFQEPQGIISACCLTIPTAFREEARERLFEWGYDFKRPLVALHPGSGNRKKCWPLRNFENLINHLEERYNCFFVLFSGPAEVGTILQKIVDYVGDRKNTCLRISGHDLTSVASLLSLSNSYIGNDSGITHLAASVMNGRVIAIFGPTDPCLWGPRANEAVIIPSNRACAPCETKSRGCRVQDQSEYCNIECLSSITVQRVLEQCEFSSA